MFPIERHQAILRIIENKSAVTVSDLSKELYIGEATIRRDLEQLAKDGLLNRTHGGAVKLLTANTEVPFMMRDNVQVKSKEQMASVAAELIRDGETLFFDSSSSVLRIVPHLENKRFITVITNGIKTALELGKTGIKTICTGGLLNGSTTTLVGGETVRMVKKFCADKFFFSCRAMTVEDGILESSTDGSEVKEAMGMNSRVCVLLCDSQKLDRTAFTKLDLLDRVRYLVTDEKLNEKWTDSLRDKNIKVLI